MKKIISFILSLLIAVNVLPATVFAEETEEPSLEDIIRPQIEAFAKSIDQKDADGAAADAIATHGMFGRGKDLRVDESHALTAMLINAEFMKAFLTAICVDSVKIIMKSEKNKLYCEGSANWHRENHKYYDYHIYDFEKENDDKPIKNGGLSNYTAEINSYDDSLVWIAGDTIEYINIEKINVCRDTIMYNISAVVYDRFDFDTSNNSGFIGLISGIGALLFKEFDWYSTFDFQIEIPNDCEHSFGEWKQTKAPTYYEEGEEQRACSSCGCVDTRAVAALDYLLGDPNGDEKINVLDANLVRKYAAKSFELSEKQLAAADTNGDGKVNVLDANLIRKYSAKIIDSFPATK